MHKLATSFGFVVKRQLQIVSGWPEFTDFRTSNIESLLIFLEMLDNKRGTQLYLGRKNGCLYSELT